MANNVGKKPVAVVDGVEVVLANGVLKVTGSKGNLELKMPHGITVEVVDKVATVKRLSDSSDMDKYVGLVRALLSNMVTGVSVGFTKNLELSGVGYRAKIEGRDLVLNVGYANAVRITPPEGITIATGEAGLISVSGIDRAIIGDVASKIREVRVPDPYKAKGIKYAGEKVRRKVGKAAKAVGAK